MVGGGTVLCLTGAMLYLNWQEAREIEQVRREQPVGPPTLDNFAPSQVVPEQPEVTGIEIIPATPSPLDDDELVLAIELNGETRAYPINVMTGPEREIFNDTLGGRPLAATW